MNPDPTDARPAPAARPVARRAAWWALLLPLLLAACASPGLQPAPRAVAAPAAAGLAEDAATPFPDAAWWRAFGDPALDALVERALAQQPGLQVAAARLARAAAVLAQTEAVQGPQVGGAFDATRQRYTAHGLVPRPIAGATWTSASLQANASLELDFFGRHEAALTAALGQQRAAAAELQAARVLLAANVARGYAALARLFQLRAVAQRTLDQRASLRELTRQRVDAGLDSLVELRLTEAAVPDARAQLQALDGQIALARHQLAVLSGQPPQALDGFTPGSGTLQPVALPARLGADLLGRRADVVAARWRVEAALQDVALARTQFYPDVNLVAFAGLSSLGLDRLLELGSRNLGAGPALRLPLFDGGRLRANLRGRSADADAAVAAYDGAVLDAVREVADAGATLQALARQQAEVAQALAAAEAAHALARQRHAAGLANLLTVLSAETAVLAQRWNSVDLAARSLDAQVQLMRALGGGWRDEAPDRRAAR